MPLRALVRGPSLVWCRSRCARFTSEADKGHDGEAESHAFYGDLDQRAMPRMEVRS